MIVTLEDLQAKDACQPAMSKFEAMFPLGMVVSAANIRRCLDANLSEKWWLREFFPDLLPAYREACAEYETTYSQVTAPDYAAFFEACKPIDAKYEAACQPIADAYNASERKLESPGVSLSDDYDRAVRPNFTDFKADCLAHFVVAEEEKQPLRAALLAATANALGRKRAQKTAFLVGQLRGIGVLSW